MKLYHGTNLESAKNICKYGISIKNNRSATDFGPGFYMTDDYNQAKHWAFRKSELNCDAPAVVTIIMNDDFLDKTTIFNDDLQWGRFIMNNRNGLEYIEKMTYRLHNLNRQFDITCGRIADIEVVPLSRKLQESGLELDSIEGIFNPDYHLQYVLHTEDSLKYVIKTSYRNIK